MEKLFNFALGYIACLLWAILAILISSLYLDISLWEEMTSIRPYISAFLLAVTMVVLRTYRDEE